MSSKSIATQVFEAIEFHRYNEVYPLLEYGNVVPKEENCMEWTMLTLIERGDQEMLRWFHINYGKKGRTCTYGRVWLGDVGIYMAILKGHLQLLSWFFTLTYPFPRNLSPSVADILIEKGHIGLAKRFRTWNGCDVKTGEEPTLIRDCLVNTAVFRIIHHAHSLLIPRAMGITENSQLDPRKKYTPGQVMVQFQKVLKKVCQRTRAQIRADMLEQMAAELSERNYMEKERLLTLVIRTLIEQNRLKPLDTEGQRFKVILL